MVIIKMTSKKCLVCDTVCGVTPAFAKWSENYQTFCKNLNVDFPIQKDATTSTSCRSTKNQNCFSNYNFCDSCMNILSQLELLKRQLESVQSNIFNCVANLSAKVIKVVQDETFQTGSEEEEKTQKDENGDETSLKIVQKIRRQIYSRFIPRLLIKDCKSESRTHVQSLSDQHLQSRKSGQTKSVDKKVTPAKSGQSNSIDLIQESGEEFVVNSTQIEGGLEFQVKLEELPFESDPDIEFDEDFNPGEFLEIESDKDMPICDGPARVTNPKIVTKSKPSLKSKKRKLIGIPLKVVEYEEGKFICDSKWTFEKLQNENDSKILFKCGSCNISCTTKSHVKRHIKRKHKREEKHQNSEGSSIIPMEGVESFSEQRRKLGLKKWVKKLGNGQFLCKNKWIFEQKEFGFQCATCNKVNRTHKGMIEHIRKIHFPSAYTCNTCHKPFKSQRTLEKHNCDVKEYVQTVNCGNGQYLYDRKWSFEATADGFKCGVCGLEYLKRDCVVAHIKTRHAVGKVFVCHLCGKDFCRKQAFEQHMTTHSDARPCLCDDCGKTFKTVHTLYKHQRKTHQELKFACHFCPKRFKTDIGLQKHLKSHSIEIVPILNL